MIGVDIGIYHMGVIGCEINRDYSLNNIDFCELVDIKNYRCENDCKLFHDECIADYMSHFFKKYKYILDKADNIIIERQPPMGLIAVQELLVYKYRNKSILVSPNSMHCHYSMNNLNYEERKIRVIKITENKLKKFELFNKLVRKHDLADALCILQYYLFKKNLEFRKEQEKQEYLKNYSTIIKKLESFKYIGSLPSHPKGGIGS